MRAAISVALVLTLGLLAVGFPVTVVDDRGREIVIPAPPQRVVVAGVALYAQILVDLGAVDLLVGVTSSPDNPPQVEGLPEVGPAFSPSLEAIVALSPDLVLGAWGEVRDRLEELGLVVLTVGQPGGWLTGIPDVLDAIRTVGRAVGRAREADALCGRISEEIVRLEAQLLSLPPVRVAFLYMSAPDSPPYVVGTGTPEHELILRAGGENVFADLSGYPQVSLEELILRDPEVIITDPAQVENVLGSQALAGVAAVKGGRVYGIPASQVVSTRVAEVLRQLAELLHPEAFAP